MKSENYHWLSGNILDLFFNSDCGFPFFVLSVDQDQNDR